VDKALDDSEELPKALEPWQQKLVAENMRLVSWWASKFPFEDQEELRSVGYIGMCEAALRYDPNRGPFGSYAAWWVRAKIGVYMRDSKTPVRVITTREDRLVLSRINKAKKALGGDPSREKLAEHLGVGIDSVERVATMLARGNVSIDERIEGRKQLELTDMRAPSEDDLAEHFDDETYQKRLHAALSILDARERLIIEECHLSDPPATLASMGSTLEVSRERARQIQNRALEKLRIFFQRRSRKVRAPRIYECTQCGATPRVVASTLCASCKRKYENRKARIEARHQAKLAERRTNGKCLRCGRRQAYVGTEHCSMCT